MHGQPDRIEQFKADLAELKIQDPSSSRDQLAARLPAEASTRNPVDLIASGGPDQFEHATSLLLESGEVDSVMVGDIQPRGFSRTVRVHTVRSIHSTD